MLRRLLASAPSTVTEPAEPAHPQRVVVVGLGALEQLTEDLVVPTGRQFEALLDERLLGAGLVPPASFEIQDRPVAFCEFHRRRCSSANRSDASTLGGISRLTSGARV